MKNIIRIYGNVLKWLASVILGVIFLNVILQIFSRTFLVSVPSWTEEVGSYLLIWLVAIAAGILFLDRKPIGIDFIFENLSKRGQNFITALNILLSISFLILLIIGSFQLAEKSLEVRSPALNLPFSYIFISLAIAGILMIISIILRQIDQSLTRRKEILIEDKVRNVQ